MAEEVQSNIRVNIDTQGALASIKALQTQISAFHMAMAKATAASAAASSALQQQLVKSINQTGKFSASFTTVESSATAFTRALEKNKLSMGEYFRYSLASSKSFGKVFQQEFDTIQKVAVERVKTLQSQYIKLGRDANGAIQAIKVRPLTLDMQNLGTKTAIAAQKQQILNKLLEQGSTNLLNFGKNTQWAGRQLMVGFTIPLGMFSAAAIKSYQQIEQQMVMFKRVYGDFSTSSSETDKMAKQVQNLANQFTKYGIAVKDTLDMAASAAAAGKTGNDLLTTVSQASRLSALGGVTQQKALETTISLTNAFKISSKDLGSTMDYLNAVQNQTVLSIDDITTAIPKAAPVVKQLGGNVQDLAFFLTAMKQGGINASQGANALKSGLSSMINPTAAASKMLSGFGINIKGIVNDDKGNLRKTVTDLALALDKLDPLNRAKAIETMFGKFQFARISALLTNVVDPNSQAATAAKLALQTQGQLHQLAQRELAKTAASPMYQFQKSIQDFQVAMAPIGETFLKVVTPVMNGINGILKGFNSLSPGLKSGIVGFVSIVAGLGPILLMTFGLVANGVANVIKGFSKLKNFFNGVTSSTNTLGEQTQYMTQQQLEAATAAASLDQVHSKLKQTLTLETKIVNELTAAYERSVAAQDAFMATGAGKKASAAATKKYATGGIFRGPGTGTSDSILAKVSNGEAIIPAASVAQHPDVVQSLISGNLPAYASGYMPYVSEAQKAYKAEQAAKIAEVKARNLAASQKRAYVKRGPALFVNSNTLRNLGVTENHPIAKDIAEKQFTEKILIGNTTGTWAEHFNSPNYMMLRKAGLKENRYETVKTTSFKDLMKQYRMSTYNASGAFVKYYAQGGIVGMLENMFSKKNSLMRTPADMDKVYTRFMRGKTDLAVRMRSEQLLSKLKSGDLAYSNGFQDNPESAYSDLSRLNVEESLFGLSHNAPASDRPIYGIAGDSRLPWAIRNGKKSSDMSMFRSLYNNTGGSGLDRYGDVSLILKNSVKKRSTYTIGDTFTSKNYKNEPNKSVPAKFGTMSRSKILASKSLGNWSENNFIEAQIFGGLPFSDVKKILVKDPTLIPVLQEALAAAGLDIPVTMRKLGLGGQLATMLYGKKKVMVPNGTMQSKIYHPWASPGEISQYASGGIIGTPSESLMQQVKGTSAIIAYGAHQPFTTAHQGIAQMGMDMSQQSGIPFFQFTSNQGKAKRSVLGDDLKSRMISEAIGRNPEFAKNPFELMAILSKVGIKDVNILLGEDRMKSPVWEAAAKEFGIIITKTGIPRPVGSTSGTMARAAAASGNIGMFESLLASGMSKSTKSEIFKSLFSAATGRGRKFSNGGMISGPGSGTSDSILARVSNGEAIIPANSVLRHPTIVQSLISGGLPRFADGGIADSNSQTAKRPRSAKYKPTADSVKKFKGLTTAPGAISKQRLTHTWSTRQAEEAAIMAKAEELGLSKAITDRISWTHASHINEDFTQDPILGNVKNWKADNLITDFGGINAYSQTLSRSKKLPGGVDAAYIAEKLKISKAMAQKELDKIAKGIHPTTQRSADVMREIAAQDSSYQGQITKAILDARKGGDFYDPKAQKARSYDPSKDAAVAKNIAGRTEQAKEVLAQRQIEAGIVPKTTPSTPAVKTTKKQTGVSVTEDLGYGYTKNISPGGRTTYFKDGIAVKSADVKRDLVKLREGSAESKIVQSKEASLAQQEAEAARSGRKGNALGVNSGGKFMGIAMGAQMLMGMAQGVPGLSGVANNPAISTLMNLMLYGGMAGQFLPQKLMSKIAPKALDLTTSLGSKIPGKIGNYYGGMNVGAKAVQAGATAAEVGASAAAGEVAGSAVAGAAAAEGGLAAIATAAAPVAIGLGVLALGVWGVSAAMKAAADAEKKRIQSINDLGDAAMLTASQLKNTANAFGYTLQQSAFDLQNKGVNSRTAKGGLKGQTEVAQILNGEFKDAQGKDILKSTYETQIRTLKTATPKEQSQLMRSLALQLQGSGMSQADTQALLDAIAIKAGKTNTYTVPKTITTKNLETYSPGNQNAYSNLINSLKTGYDPSKANKAVNGGLFGFGITYNEQLAQDRRILASYSKGGSEYNNPNAAQNIKSYKTRIQQDIKDIDNAILSPQAQKNLNAYSKDVSAQLQGLSSAFISGTVNAKTFNSGFASITKSLNNMSKTNADIILKKLMNDLKIPTDSQKLVNSVTNVTDKMKVLKMITEGMPIDKLKELIKLLNAGNTTAAQAQMDAFTASIEKTGKANKASTEASAAATALQAKITKLGNAQSLLSIIEGKINATYQKRIDALTQIAQINQQIAQSQKDQLSLASALSQGDVGAAVSAVQTMQTNNANNALQSQQQALQYQQTQASANAFVYLNGKKYTSAQLQVLIDAANAKNLTTTTPGLSTTRATGGHITGPGTGTSDQIPAMLSNGEYVIRAAAVKKIGVNALDRMNHAEKFASGGMAGYASGGMSKKAPSGRLKQDYTPDWWNPQSWIMDLMNFGYGDRSAPNINKSIPGAIKSAKHLYTESVTGSPWLANAIAYGKFGNPELSDAFAAMGVIPGGRILGRGAELAEHTPSPAIEKIFATINKFGKLGTAKKAMPQISEVLNMKMSKQLKFFTKQYKDMSLIAGNGNAAKKYSIGSIDLGRDPFNGSTIVKGIFRDADSNYVGAFHRKFYPDHVKHEFLNVFTPGTGLGTAFGHASEEMYQRLGINRIDVSAGLTHGGWAWAKAGYKFKLVPELLIDKIKAFQELIHNDELGDIEHRFSTLKLKDAGYPTPQEIAGIKGRVNQGLINLLEQKIHGNQQLSDLIVPGDSIGKAILMGSSWDGIKMLGSDTLANKAAKAASKATGGMVMNHYAKGGMAGNRPLSKSTPMQEMLFSRSLIMNKISKYLPLIKGMYSASNVSLPGPKGNELNAFFLDEMNKYSGGANSNAWYGMSVTSSYPILKKLNSGLKHNDEIEGLNFVVGGKTKITPDEMDYVITHESGHQFDNDIMNNGWANNILNVPGSLRRPGVANISADVAERKWLAYNKQEKIKQQLLTKGQEKHTALSFTPWGGQNQWQEFIADAMSGATRRLSGGTMRMKPSIFTDVRDSGSVFDPFNTLDSSMDNVQEGAAGHPNEITSERLQEMGYAHPINLFKMLNMPIPKKYAKKDWDSKYPLIPKFDYETGDTDHLLKKISGSFPVYKPLRLHGEVVHDTVYDPLNGEINYNTNPPTYTTKDPDSPIYEITLNKDGSAARYAKGGMVMPKYFATGGMVMNHYAKGGDVVPAMLTPGEFVVRKAAVDRIGSSNLNAMNNGTNSVTTSGDSVYNYSVNVNVATGANANDIAQTVMRQIKQIDAQRVRGNAY